MYIYSYICSYICSNTYRDVCKGILIEVYTHMCSTTYIVICVRHVYMPLGIYVHMSYRVVRVHEVELCCVFELIYNMFDFKSLYNRIF